MLAYLLVWPRISSVSALSGGGGEAGLVEGEEDSESGQDTEETQVPKEKPLSIYTIEEGDTFAIAVEKFGISYSEMLEIMSAADEIYDFSKVRLGRELRYRKTGEKVTYLEYDMHTESKVVVTYVNDEYFAEEVEIEYDITEEYAEGTINSSLFVAGAEAGLADAVILEMAEIFGWSIDFSTSIREGDSFKIAYEKRTRDGEDAMHGRVFAAEFTNNGTTFKAILFEDEDGKVRYYDEEGNSTVRQFLKAPLKFSRITSGFSYNRFHPVLGKNYAHMAIDYAAPAGTPILATANGVVSFANWNGGFGRYIDIRHNGTYETQYAHLSGFANGVKAGARVSQGQVIGYVGSTGYSTGPHLHYQIKKNGTLVNPLTIELPAGDPIEDDEREEFERVKAEFLAKLQR